MPPAGQLRGDVKQLALVFRRASVWAAGHRRPVAGRLLQKIVYRLPGLPRIILKVKPKLDNSTKIHQFPGLPRVQHMHQASGIFGALASAGLAGCGAATPELHNCYACNDATFTVGREDCKAFEESRATC